MASDAGRYGHYGDRWADIYDQRSERVGFAHPTETVDVLAELAGPGPALELGIGTGRVALPLSERGVEVHGIDASEAMVRRLKAKSGGGRIPVVIGDFAAVPVRGSYRLVFVVFNTLFSLLTQEEQVRCFRNVAPRLAADGVFLVEAFMPDPTLFDRGQMVRARWLDENEVTIDVAMHDPVRQRVSSQDVVLRPEGVQLRPVVLRYAYPPELDLMAEIAGLRLRERWGGWDRSPFGPDSGRHISIYTLR